jgi:hypothetical protein
MEGPAAMETSTCNEGSLEGACGVPAAAGAVGAACLVVAEGAVGRLEAAPLGCAKATQHR